MRDVWPWYAATLTVIGATLAALNVRDRRRVRRQADARLTDVLFKAGERTARNDADRLAADIAAARRRHPTAPAQGPMPADEWAVIERNADVIRLFRSELDHLNDGSGA
jgi:hypothetical protein